LGGRKGILVCKNILHQQFSKVLLWKIYGAPSLTWRNLWKNRPVKPKPKKKKKATRIS